MNPAITGGNAAVNNLNGQPITDQFDQPGFPGFDGLFATTTLAYVAQMQEAGIPVTFGYISDAHDQHGKAGEIHATAGPRRGRLRPATEGLRRSVREVLRPSGAGRHRQEQHALRVHGRGRRSLRRLGAHAEYCDGVNVPCTYSLVGEVNGNLAGLMAQDGVTTPFTVHSDMAPTVYITGNPSRTEPTTRTSAGRWRR